MKRTKKRSPSNELERYWERQRKRWTARYGEPYPQGSLEEMYRRGDRTVLLPELLECLTERKTVTEWLRWALMKAIARGVVFRDFDTWDDVFGPPVQTEDGRPARGKTRVAEQRRHLLQGDIYKRVVQLEAQGENVDRSLFEKIAAEFCIGRARAEQIYYDNRAMIEAAEAVVRASPPPE
jgi:hypothetical protein